MNKILPGGKQNKTVQRPEVVSLGSLSASKMKKVFPLAMKKMSSSEDIRLTLATENTKPHHREHTKSKSVVFSTEKPNSEEYFVQSDTLSRVTTPFAKNESLADYEKKKN